MRRLVACLFAFTLAGVALAQHDHGSHAASATASGMAQGEVRKVDKAAKTITLKHGPIASVDMPAMTMAFPVADPRLVDQVQPGDKVRFSAEKRGDAIVVTRIEMAK